MSNGWAIRHLQLTELAELEPDPRYAGVYLCFWHGSLPLGHVELLNRELPLTRKQVRSLAAGAVSRGVRAHLPEIQPGASPLERLQRDANTPCPALASKTSLVICTRNRPAFLERCLYSVAKLAEPAGEVLVVDNTSGDSETRRIVRLFEGVRYVIEPRPGLSRARNT
ncbi:MAG TPA: glycosyltransferase, partial [Bryobacteraceae bacterium]|nr:glycosyltransferase [Bryobacteraceae bacterium]